MSKQLRSVLELLLSAIGCFLWVGGASIAVPVLVAYILSFLGDIR